MTTQISKMLKMSKSTVILKEFWYDSRSAGSRARESQFNFGSEVISNWSPGKCEYSRFLTWKFTFQIQCCMEWIVGQYNLLSWAQHVLILLLCICAEQGDVWWWKGWNIQGYRCDKNVMERLVQQSKTYQEIIWRPPNWGNRCLLYEQVTAGWSLTYLNCMKFVFDGTEAAHQVKIHLNLSSC